jgi:hypothetical protein
MSMPEPTPDGDDAFEEPDYSKLSFFGGDYSVWDLGPFPDPDPQVAARFDVIEKELFGKRTVNVSGLSPCSLP